MKIELIPGFVITFKMRRLEMIRWLSKHWSCHINYANFKMHAKCRGWSTNYGIVWNAPWLSCWRRSLLYEIGHSIVKSIENHASKLFTLCIHKYFLLDLCVVFAFAFAICIWTGFYRCTVDIWSQAALNARQIILSKSHNQNRSWNIKFPNAFRICYCW